VSVPTKHDREANQKGTSDLVNGRDVVELLNPILLRCLNGIGSRTGLPALGTRPDRLWRDSILSNELKVRVNARSLVATTRSGIVDEPGVKLYVILSCECTNDLDALRRGFRGARPNSILVLDLSDVTAEIDLSNQLRPFSLWNDSDVVSEQWASLGYASGSR
jgi:hypothetical protein